MAGFSSLDRTTEFPGGSCLLLWRLQPASRDPGKECHSLVALWEGSCAFASAFIAGGSFFESYVIVIAAFGAAEQEVGIGSSGEESK